MSRSPPRPPCSSGTAGPRMSCSRQEAPQVLGELRRFGRSRPRAGATRSSARTRTASRRSILLLGQAIQPDCGSVTMTIVQPTPGPESGTAAYAVGWSGEPHRGLGPTAVGVAAMDHVTPARARGSPRSSEHPCCRGSSSRRRETPEESPVRRLDRGHDTLPELRRSANLVTDATCAACGRAASRLQVLGATGAPGRLPARSRSFGRDASRRRHLADVHRPRRAARRPRPASRPSLIMTMQNGHDGRDGRARRSRGPDASAPR